MDISESALAAARARLGSRADRVNWIVADARELRLGRPVDLWHDRAVFHFLTEPADQEAYLERLRESLRPGAHAVIATFAPQGPERCSGLRVERYDADKLSRRLGRELVLLRSLVKMHTTPRGAEQPFTYGLFRRGL